MSAFGEVAFFEADFFGDAFFLIADFFGDAFFLTTDFFGDALFIVDDFPGDVVFLGDFFFYFISAEDAVFCLLVVELGDFPTSVDFLFGIFIKMLFAEAGS